MNQTPVDVARDVILDLYTKDFFAPEYVQLSAVNYLLRHMGFQSSILRGVMEDTGKDNLNSHADDPWNIWAISVDGQILGAAGEREWEEIYKTAQREYQFLARFGLSEQFTLEDEVDETFIFENPLSDAPFKNWLRAAVSEIDRRQIEMNTSPPRVNGSAFRL